MLQLLTIETPMWPFKRSKRENTSSVSHKAPPANLSSGGVDDESASRSVTENELSKAEEAHLTRVAAELESQRKAKAASELLREKRLTEIHAELTPFLPIIFKQISSLRVRHDQLVTTDPYGNLITDAWRAEIDYFILRSLLGDNARLLEFLKEGGDRLGSLSLYSRLRTAIDLIVSSSHFITKTRADETKPWDSLDPIEFEQHCCKALEVIANVA